MVLMIFIHECGHAFAGHLKGKPWGIMMFIPFMGAFVTIRGGKDARRGCVYRIAGPIVGTMAGLGTLLIFAVTKNPFWLAVSSWCFMINLFNLLPVAPLDGGWIVPLFSSRILAVTAVLLLPLAYFNPLIILLALASIPRIIAG
jgi:Zn-dependent protease